MNRDQRAHPPRLPGALIARLVRAHHNGSCPLPFVHADDVLPMLDGDDAEQSAAAAELIAAARVYFPQQ